MKKKLILVLFFSICACKTSSTPDTFTCSSNGRTYTSSSSNNYEEGTETSSCSNENENFSAVYPEYNDHCCVGLQEWHSGMDTRVSVGGKCFNTGLLAGSPVGTCIKCGDGVCGEKENLCNCPQDCKISEYESVANFCDQHKSN